MPNRDVKRKFHYFTQLKLSNKTSAKLKAKMFQDYTVVTSGCLCVELFLYSLKENGKDISNINSLETPTFCEQ